MKTKLMLPLVAGILGASLTLANEPSSGNKPGNSPTTTNPGQSSPTAPNASGSGNESQQAAADKERQERFQALDTNRDGVISKEEFEAGESRFIQTTPVSGQKPAGTSKPENVKSGSN